MSATPEEFRCFVGGLSWSTTDRGLEDAFRPYSSVIEAKVIVDRDTGRSRGFGFVTFGDERSMEEAIDHLHGKDLDGRLITVNRAQQKSKGEGGDRYSGGGGGGRSGGRSGSGGDNCFKCGQSGHWARECTGGGGGTGSRYSRDRNGSRGERYGGSDRHGGGGGSRYSGSDRYGSSDRYSNGEGNGRSSGSHRDRDSGRSERYSSGGGGAARGETGHRDRSGPYDRPSGGRSSHDDRY